MVKGGRVVGLGVTLACLMLVPRAAVAQNTGIAGVVRDTSGGVIPGVTVEASSPALIEKVRSVVTDAQGLYTIVDLRPGVYAVTFSLPGFQTVKREGIELVGSFTASVNTELKVGALEETVTVAGAVPTVDVRNVVQQKVLTNEVREALPSGRSVQMMAQIIPGITQNPVSRPSGQDVGGLSGERGTLQIHGSRGADFTYQVDGSAVTIGSTGGNQAFNLNPTEAQEFVYELGAISAETVTGGVRVNVIPKEGGNRFVGQFMGAYVRDGMQTNNLTDELRAKGLTSVNNVLKVWDYNWALGGPIKANKLWFFGSYRDWGQKETIAGMFRPIDPTSFLFNPALGAAGNVDLSRPGILNSTLHTVDARLTWQASPRNKFTFWAVHHPRDQDGAYMTGTRSYEASIHQEVVMGRILQAVWKSPVTSRLLVEAAYADVYSQIPQNEISGVGPDVIGVNDVGTGIQYRSATGASSYSIYNYYSPNLKAAVSYVTGSHVAKFGVAYDWGYDHEPYQRTHAGINYTLRNGVPTSVTVFNSPRNFKADYRNVGIFAQDQWTLKRLTVNAGVRVDRHTESILPQTSGPGPYAGLITWPEVNDVPNWKDISPRVGVVYDAFGNGKTAVKATFSRYLGASTVAFSTSQNPMNFNVTATRAWTDANRDFIPQESELGPLSNRNFATAATTNILDDAVRTGWGARLYNWETSIGVQHELFPQVGVNVTYFRRSYGNFTVADNLLVTPADYTQYCIAAPADARLPGGGGNQVCGLYDLNPNKLGQVNNLTTFADKYGTQRETFNGVDASFNVRLQHRVLLSGGLSSGTNANTGTTNTSSTDACFVVDTPQQLYCKVDVKWQTGFKFLGTVGLPWGIDAGTTFQANPGPEIRANYTIASAQALGLGRNLVAGSATIPLIAPGTVFGDRIYQLDLRLSKSFRFRALRLRGNLDLANALNASAVLIQNNTYGSNWLIPAYVLPGRVIRPSVQIDF